MKTVMEHDAINFLWIYKCYDEDEYKSLSYVTHVLGHEGKNSILSYLIHEGLATELLSGYHHRCKAFSYVECSITLTKKGLKNYKKVIEIVYTLINFLKEDCKKNGPQQHVFEEYRDKGKLGWEFIEK